MSLSLNKVVLAGRLTADPELKATTSGISVTQFTLAVDRYMGKDADKRSDFISIVAWRQTAEFITRHFRRGSALCVVGSIQTRSWTDQNGGKRYATEVVADEAHFVESKGSSEQGAVAPAPATPTPMQQLEDINQDDLPF